MCHGEFGEFRSQCCTARPTQQQDFPVRLWHCRAPHPAPAAAQDTMKARVQATAGASIGSVVRSVPSIGLRGLYWCAARRHEQHACERRPRQAPWMRACWRLLLPARGYIVLTALHPPCSLFSSGPRGWAAGI